MKKAFYLLAIIFAACTFTSCDEKNNPENTNSGNASDEPASSNPLYGTWELTAWYFSSYSGEPFTNDKLTPYPEENQVLIFSEDVMFSNGAFSYARYDYQFSDSKILIYNTKYGDWDDLFDVISLSNKELVLRMESCTYYKFDKIPTSNKYIWSSLVGSWAILSKGNDWQTGSFILWDFDEKQFRERYIHGTYVDGIMYDAYEDDEDKQKNKSSAPINYTYHNGELKYSGALGTLIDVDDNDHFTLYYKDEEDGKHYFQIDFTRIKAIKSTTAPVTRYTDPDQINLNLYDPYAESSCWAVVSYSGSAEATEYTWSNEYWLAAGVKLALEILEGTDIAYSWHAVNASNEDDCEARNID